MLGAEPPGWARADVSDSTDAADHVDHVEHLLRIADAGHVDDAPGAAVPGVEQEGDDLVAQRPRPSELDDRERCSGRGDGVEPGTWGSWFGSSGWTCGNLRIRAARCRRR